MTELYFAFLNLDQQNVNFLRDALRNPLSLVVFCLAFLGILYVVLPIAYGHRELATLPRRNLRMMIFITCVVALVLASWLIN